MILLVTALSRNDYFVAEVDATDMVTSINWKSPNLQYELEDHDAWFYKESAEYPSYPLRGEELIAYVENTKGLKQPPDYYYLEGMRKPSKRDKNLRFCVTFEANAEYYTIKETIQDVTQYNPNIYHKEFRYQIRDKEPYFIYSRRGTPIYHVKGYGFMFNNGIKVPRNDFINKRKLGL